MPNLPTHTDESNQPRRLGCLPDIYCPLPDDFRPRKAEPGLEYPARMLPDLCDRAAGIMRHQAERMGHNNQGPVGSCTLTQYVHQLYYLREEGDKDRIKLAEGSGYYWTVNRQGQIVRRKKNEDHGETLHGGCLIARVKGFAPVSLVPQRDWRGRYWSPDDPTIKEATDDFRGIEWVDPSATLEMILSVLARGKPVGIGFNGHAWMLLAPTKQDYSSRKIPVFNSWEFAKRFDYHLTFGEAERGRRDYKCAALFTAVDPGDDGDVR